MNEQFQISIYEGSQCHSLALELYISPPGLLLGRWLAKGKNEAWERPRTLLFASCTTSCIFEGPHPCLISWLITHVMTCFSYGNNIALILKSLISLLQQCLWFCVYTLILLPKGRWGRNQRSRSLNRCISTGASILCLYALLAIVAQEKYANFSLNTLMASAFTGLKKTTSKICSSSIWL